jgi:hypothetical protein
MNYWQVAAGAEGRDYAYLFFDYGIMCVGGDQYEKRIKEVKKDDIVVLKGGRREILGAGIIQEKDEKINHIDEDWLGDFEGWNLKDYVYVEWHRPKEPIEVSEGLTIGTLFRMYDETTKKIAHEIIDTYPKIIPKPKPDLSQIKKIDDNSIINYLIKQGLRPRNAEELTNTFNTIRLLVNFYYEECNWDEVREHETRTFLIMPLLFALGWSEQKLKLELPTGERRRIDIACFNKPFIETLDEEKKNCILLIESKGFSQGLDTARAQAVEYAKAFPNCDKIIVSNGFCYKAFCKDGPEFSTMPSAYMNLRNPKDKHPLYPESKGTLEIFKMLLP